MDGAAASGVMGGRTTSTARSVAQTAAARIRARANGVNSPASAAVSHAASAASWSSARAAASSVSAVASSRWKSGWRPGPVVEERHLVRRDRDDVVQGPARDADRDARDAEREQRRRRHPDDGRVHARRVAQGVERPLRRHGHASTWKWWLPVPQSPATVQVSSITT